MGAVSRRMIESILPRENADAFKTILTEYVPQGTPVLDSTTGHKQFWRTIMGQTALDGQPQVEMYPVTFLDIRNMGGIDVKGDLRHLPFAPGTFGCVVFDPPYIHPRGGDPHKPAANRGLWENDSFGAGMYSYRVLRKLIDLAGIEFHRVLKKPGIVIVKLMNVRESAKDGGTVFPEAAYCWKGWHRYFRLEGWLIQPITRAGAVDWALRFEHVHKCHTDWLVFRRAK